MLLLVERNNMTYVENILNDLEERRRQLGMSSAVVADRARLPLRTVRRILMGETSARLDNLAAIANALEVDLGIVRKNKADGVKRRQAKRKAREIVSIAQGSSALEAQPARKKALDQATKSIEHDLLAGSRLRLWSK
ncbi:MAG: helix-turn-helix transcriptional regulator [Planctomycetaceae bacterium]|nr:helix-turn-helix domain-containing protein [Planctomycetaceae bacterium]